MGKDSAIEWTDDTWNPWRGCIKISPGCKQCYMYRDQERYGNNPRVITRASDTTFNAPLRWPAGHKVFTCSWSDFFIERADEWRDDAWNIIRRTPQLTYQILTKRPQYIHDRLPDDWGDGWPNVWLGVSVENDDYLWRIETLAEIPAAIRFVSYEPALGPINIYTYAPVIHWLIAGGESGYNPRPANLDWFRDVRDQCRDHGIAFFFKQIGGSKRIGHSWGGSLLDGIEYKEFPQQCPTCHKPLADGQLFCDAGALKPY